MFYSVFYTALISSNLRDPALGECGKCFCLISLSITLERFCSFCLAAAPKAEILLTISQWISYSINNSESRDTLSAKFTTHVLHHCTLIKDKLNSFTKVSGFIYYNDNIGIINLLRLNKIKYFYTAMIWDI